MAQQFAERAFVKRGKKFSGFTAESQAALQGYRWPGNVRELLNVVERAALVDRATGKTVDVCPFMGVQPASQMAHAAPLTLVQGGTGTGATSALTPPAAQPTAQKDPVVLTLQDPIESYTSLKKRWSLSFEREYLAAMLARHGGNVSAAAREAHLDRSNFLRLLRRHRMTAQEFRHGEMDDSASSIQKKAA
jgi:anaerobic nitric oxide reductase transcription regulator